MKNKKTDVKKYNKLIIKMIIITKIGKKCMIKFTEWFYGKRLHFTRFIDSDVLNKEILMLQLKHAMV